jgi:hypothetical protein
MSESIWKPGQRVRVGAHVSDSAGLVGTVVPAGYSDLMSACAVVMDDPGYGFPGLPALFMDSELEALEEPAALEAGK